MRQQQHYSDWSATKRGAANAIANTSKAAAYQPATARKQQGQAEGVPDPAQHILSPTTAERAAAGRMVKTHLPTHMDSARQWLRPKHHLLILKCYPRLPKNSSADVKPNGSELSYLLYYAGTRRSKLQKVGVFLERKTAKDVYRAQSVRAVVTLQILSALLENKAVGAGSGFTLIAPYVLKIIREILENTADLSLIEASLATWEVFCQHQDQATLKADHEYRELYADVVRRYAAFARKDSGKKLGKSTQQVAVHDAIRLREAGLGAMKSILLSDGLASESGRQLDVVVPAILSNLRGEDEGYLTNLLGMSKRNEEDEKDKAIARRMSMATVRTHTNVTDASFETDPRQAEGTASDADELAEEGVAVLGLDCLRAVFVHENRPQVRSATSAVLKYLTDLRYERPSTRMTEKSPVQSSPSDSWATKLFEICTTWTPVQDRFILMVTAVETLIRIPLKEADLAQHLLFTHLIDHILRSDLNLIGLSVMDILLSLVQQILRVLQLNGPRVAGRSSAAQLFSSEEELDHPTSSSPLKPTNDLPSEARIRLTERLKHCISDLATHVYYTDQIADMLSAILMRLKPNAAPAGQQNAAVTAAAIEEPRAAVAEVAANVSTHARERSNSTSSGFFSFDTARQIALEAARDLLHVANSAQTLSAGGVADSRNKVPISIWEGTQWLLRDPAVGVRRAYVDALTTWLALETKKSDARIQQPKAAKKRNEKEGNGVIARRAVSNASQKKEKAGRKATSTFLQLLHLAVYENALFYAKQPGVEGERETLVLHYLLYSLVQKLGVNAIISALPMVFALQEEVAGFEATVAKVRVGSLVLGYLWTLVEVFDIDFSNVGREIFNEIKRRKSNGLWSENVGSVPPKGLDAISVAPNSSASATRTGDTEALRPFTQRQALVNCISEAYAEAVASPLPSPSGSPGRSPGGGRRLSVSVPSLDRAASNYLNAKKTGPTNDLPDKAKEAMLETWTRESCLAAIAAAAPKSVSLSGSRSSPSHVLAAGNHRQLLSAANVGGTTSPVRKGSLPKNQILPSGTPAEARQQAFGPRLHSQSPHRRPSGSSANGVSSAGARGTIHVEDLKKVLAGGNLAFATGGGWGKMSNAGADDTASESVVDVQDEDLGSENGGSGFATPPQTVAELRASGVPEVIPEEGRIWVPAGEGDAASGADAAPPQLSLSSDIVTNGQMSTGAGQQFEPAVANGQMPTGDPTVLGQQFEPNGLTQPPPSRGGASVRSNRGRSRKELAALLAGVGDSSPAAKGESKFAGMMGKPPY
ncbi:plasma membrane localization protein [Vermiconidia calcicola]|uniref:Plasma membrane localization protein n=1 Tax=Vermiconidia calcicola TaxID=1690605 RepID=A0ACC3MQN8_9PEZI|nr:plasma membrane localization protein [Vermiconidia calcicola]